MKKYIKIYIEFYDIGEQDKPICEYCGEGIIVDIHHLIFKSQGGKDEIHNLIGLCRQCHERSHSSKEFNQLLKKQKDNEFNRD